MRPLPPPADLPLTRRDLLRRGGLGMGLLGLAGVLGDAGLLHAEPSVARCARASRWRPESRTLPPGRGASFTCS